MRLGSTMKLAVAALLLVLSGTSDLLAQKSTETRGTMVLTEGRRYLVGFPQVQASATEKPMPQPMQLFISSKSKGKVRVQTPAAINDAARIDKEYNVEPNKVLRIPIPIGYMNQESESRKGYGILVTSTKPISVSTYQAWMGNGELARHLPVEGWGKNYYSMNMYQDRYGTAGAGYKYRPSQILVIADKDNTVLSYTPTFDTEGGFECPSVRKGTTQTITLEKGETFLIKAKIDENKNKEWDTDLSGSWIRANKPISVISGHVKCAILRYPDVLPPTGMFAAEAHFVRSNVHDAMLPIEMAGTKFVTVPCMYTPLRNSGAGQAGAAIGIEDDRGDVIRVVALEDGTTVKSMRTDGGGLKNEWMLRKGETRIVSRDYAVYWESDKPILMGQYGKSYAKVLPPGARGSKDGEGTEGHPTVESGMPMLQYVPSADRWVEYGVFHSPEGMDNFFNIVFKKDEIGKIKIDGRALTSAFGGAMRLLDGTPYAYIRTPIGTGDHYVESTDPKVRWAAWNYGSLDGLQQGRAYGTPISVDMTIPCDDSLIVVDELVCGDVTAKGTILPEKSSCGSIFAVYPEDLNNYTLEVDENFNSGDQEVNFTLKVEDKTKDAIAVVRVVTRSGKYVEKTYTYIADKISWTPSRLDFGTLAYNTPNSKTITIKNEKTDRPVLIKKIRVMANQQIFQVSPEGPVTLGPGESRDFAVTATIQTAPLVVDTVICELGCYDQKTVELRVRGEEPQIYVSDVDWGTVPASSPGVERRVKIQNGSNVELVVTGYQQNLLDGTGNFFDPKTIDGKPLTSAFPLTIPGNGTYEFYVTYSPKGDAANAHRVDVPFYSNAKEVDSIAILKGAGVTIDLDAVATPWVERVLDNVQTTQNIKEYTQSVKFYNYGKQTVTFDAPTIRGKDAARFRVVDNGTVGTFPIQLVGGGADESRSITVAFVPTDVTDRSDERNDYEAELVFPTNSKEMPELVEKLNGTAWQPHVKGADLDFPGTFNLGDAAQVLSIPIANISKDNESNPTSGNANGTYDVVITNIRITDPNTKFELVNAPTPQNPWRIKPGEQPAELQVRFDPQSSGTFSSPYVIETNVGTNGQAPYEPVYNITARVMGGEFTAVGSDGDQYVFNEKILTVKVTHTENVTRRFSFSDVEGPDQSVFMVLPDAVTGANFIDVAPGQTGIINVRFTPQQVTKVSANQTWLGTPKATANSLTRRNNVYEGTVRVIDEITKKEQTATVSGNGLYLETTNKIAETYSAAPGKFVDVAIELEATPESIDNVGMTELRVRMNYDPSFVKPRINPGDIILTGTQMEGWTVLNVSRNGAPSDALNNLEIDLADMRTVKTKLANSSNLPAFKVRFDVFLPTKAGTFTTPVGLYTYWVDHNRSGERLDYTLFRDIPGKITVTLPCANVRRLAEFSSAVSGVKPMRPNPVVNTGVINYSVGVAGDARIALYNAMGEEVAVLVNEWLQAGNYELTADLSSLPTGTYYYQVVAGPYTSEPQSVTVVK
ncbi:MAG: hypothetical protein RLZZ273_824 [Bacteroidota bacterium]|jgi:hypothetical protein